MTHPVSRRSFLAAGAGLVVAAACGGKSGSNVAGKGPTTTASGAKAALAQPSDLVVSMATAQLLAGRDNRVAVGIFKDAELLPADVPVQLAFGRGAMSPPQPAERHSQGIETRPYYRTTFRFDRPGAWVVQATAGGKSGSSVFEVVDPASSKVPLVGQKMISTPTPTTADHRGVNPICTRNPPCPFHQVSLDQALTAGKPLAALFATPALCQSRTCGPVTDVLLNESAPYNGKIQFVHVEVYKSLQTDFSANDRSPGMKAYNLDFEPVLFLAGADGVIRQRLDGPYDVIECRQALQTLVS